MGWVRLPKGLAEGLGPARFGWLRQGLASWAVRPLLLSLGPLHLCLSVFLDLRLLWGPIQDRRQEGNAEDPLLAAPPAMLVSEFPAGWKELYLLHLVQNGKLYFLKP